MTNEEIVGEAIVKRRLAMKMSQSGLARAARVDPKTVRSVESASSWPQDTKRADIENALEWPIGTMDRIRASGKVAQSEIERPAPRADEAVEPPAEARQLRGDVVVSADRIAALSYQAQLIRKRFMLLDPADLEPEEWDDLLRDSMALALEIEAFAMRAVGPARLRELTDGRVGSIKIDLPPLPDELDDTPPAESEYGLAARETPPGYRKGKPTPDE